MSEGGRMVKLEKSELLGREIRKDDWSELGVSTWTKIKEAISSGRSGEALALVDYLIWEGKGVHDIYPEWIWDWMTMIAEKWGEEEIYNFLRHTGELLQAPAIKRSARIPVEEFVRMRVESMRSHRSGSGERGDITVVEEKDRFVLSFDPCGSGGRMRRHGELDRKRPRTEPPYNFGKTKKGYPWSWGKVGVPYYCLHCCVWSEIMPVELIGYPLRVCEYSDDPEAKCSWIIYKKPELIPEKYFTRIGQKKDPSRFIR